MRGRKLHKYFWSHDHAGCQFIWFKVEEGKEQELFHSNTIPDPVHHMGKVTKTQENTTRKRDKRVGVHKAARNRQGSITKIMSLL